MVSGLELAEGPVASGDGQVPVIERDQLGHAHRGGPNGPRASHPRLNRTPSLVLMWGVQ
jgi:hypothetical protein